MPLLSKLLKTPLLEPVQARVAPQSLYPVISVRYGHYSII